MFTTFQRDAALATIAGTTYAGLLTAITDWRAGTVTEAAYTGYSATRPAITWGAAANTTPAGGRQRSNSADVVFGQNTGASENEIAYGIYDAATAGNLLAIGLLDADPPIIGTMDATGDLVTAYSHGLVADQRIFVMAAPGAVLPTGVSENTAYYVLATGLTADAFAFSTTSGGVAVNATASGAAMFIPYTAVTVANLGTPKLLTGSIVVQL